MAGATIKRIRIERYKGVEASNWYPAPGLNLVLGGGDVGKTTLLDAVALLFSPTNAVNVAETDFYRRDADQGFLIEATISVPPDAGLDQHAAFTWPWVWNGVEPIVPPAPEEEGEPAGPGDQVYLVRVRASADLELNWEVVQPPDEETITFSTKMRRDIGVIRLLGDDRNDRDLRLVYGSALDRLFSDSTLRSRIGQLVAEIDLQNALGTDGAKTLADLGKQLKDAALPGDLSLGLTSSQGLSIGALIGLLAKKDEIALPLANWGAGTRRLAALQIAAAHGSDASIRVIDEIERGLEPYRLRALVTFLMDEGRQCFVTTHSAVAIAAADRAALWYVDIEGNIGGLDKDKIENQQARDPETFLSRVAVIAEGKTEVGFLTVLLEAAFQGDPLDHGVRVCYGEGNESTLRLLQALSSAGLAFGGLADNEGKNPVLWRGLKTELGNRLLQWEDGSTEENVIAAISNELLPRLLKTEDGTRHGERSWTLATRLNIAETDFPSIESALEAQGKTLREVIVAAATGSKEGAPDSLGKQWQSHGKIWFKTVRGGRELARTAVRLGAWENLKPRLLPLINALLDSAGREPLDDLSP